MKSKVHFKSHPLHPILVSFPIAFFVGTFIFDLLSVIYQQQEFRRTAFYLECGGIVFALLAAVPGFIDFLFVVPPASSGKKRAAQHGLSNVTMVILFVTALVLRQTQVAFLWVVILETAGVILLGIAGWMGGTLVYRNQIGVDHRYANAGKWKELYLDKRSGRTEVAADDELKADQLKLVHVNGSRIVICRTEKGYTAFDDRCPHRGGSLADGAMVCGTVQCPWHGSQFDVLTGTVKAGPAKENIKTYPVTVSDGRVFLMLD